MKRFTFTIVFVIAALVTGCGKSSTNNTLPSANPSAATTPSVTTTATPDITAAQAPMAATRPLAGSATTSAQQFTPTARPTQNLNGYTFTQKGDLVQNMTIARDKLNQELIQLSAKIDRASDAVKAEEQSKLGALQTQLGQLDAKLHDAEISTEANWDQTKADVEESLDEVTQAIQTASQRIDQEVNS